MILLFAKWLIFITFQIDKIGCGETKGCYSLPSSCTGSADCNYLFTYQVSGESVTIEMSAKERWVSVAFNDKKFMVRIFYNWFTFTITKLAFAKAAPSSLWRKGSRVPRVYSLKYCNARYKRKQLFYLFFHYIGYRSVIYKSSWPLLPC